jgi:hypothetical protein
VRRAGAEGERWRDVGTVALRGRSTPTAMREPVPDDVTDQVADEVKVT